MKNLADIAESYLGTPFFEHGREPGRALDCAGVAICALRELGIGVADPYYLLKGRDLHAMMLDLAGEHLARVDGEWLRGDVLFLRVPTMPNHMGIYMGSFRLLHSVRVRGVCVTPMDPAFRRAVTSAWRVRA